MGARRILLAAYSASDVLGLERTGTMDECNCGSKLHRTPHYDARQIFLCFACEACWPSKAKMFRDDVHTDPNYWHDEPLDETS
jgi:hypothetical protein